MKKLNRTLIVSLTFYAAYLLLTSFTLPNQDVKFSNCQTLEQMLADPTVTQLDLVLFEVGPNKVQIMKVLKEIVPEKSLKEIKDIVDTAPSTIRTYTIPAESQQLADDKVKLEATGSLVIFM